MFSLLLKKLFLFSNYTILLSVKAFILDESKILLIGKIVQSLPTDKIIDQSKLKAFPDVQLSLKVMNAPK